MPPQDVVTLDASADPDSLRQQAIQMVLERAEADSAAWFSVAEIDGVLRMGGWSAIGDRALDDALRRNAMEADPWRDSPAPFQRSSLAESSSFLELDKILDPVAFEQSRYFQTIFAPFRVADQIRLLVFQGSRLVAWIGASRKTGARRFNARDRKRLQALVAPVSAALCAADGLIRGNVALDRAVIVLQPGGEVDYASLPSIGWLERPGFREALRALTVETDRGTPTAERKALLDEAECRMIRVDGGSSVRYVATLTPSKQMQRSLVHALTAVQRRVAESAAAGATIAEIATELGRGAETVRSHLREVYRRLDVSTRLELARALLDLDSRG